MDIPIVAGEHGLGLPTVVGVVALVVVGVVHEPGVSGQVMVVVDVGSVEGISFGVGRHKSSQANLEKRNLVDSFILIVLSEDKE